MAIFLNTACRSKEKAEAAKVQLQGELSDDEGAKLEILLLDVQSLASVREAVSQIETSIDCLVLNAGGPGGTDFVALTEDGVANIMALNVVGNAALVHELQSANKFLKNATVLYSSSEAARGVPNFRFPPPKWESGSVEEFTSALKGSRFENDSSYETTYSWAKAMGTLWMSGMARKHPDIRWVSVSPGMTVGTNLARELGFVQRTMFSIVGPIFKFFGLGHGTDEGAGRYLDAVYQREAYESGKFYGSQEGKFTGALVDQEPLFPDLGNVQYQDNCNQAIQALLDASKN